MAVWNQDSSAFLGNLGQQATKGSSTMPIPAAAIAIPAIAQGLISLFSASQQNSQAKKAQELQQQQVTNQANATAQNNALQESTLDPFRHSMFQANDLAALDKLERASYTPTKMQVSNRYASNIPTFSGGYSYSKSPELVQAAAALKKRVMSGQGAPTMTDAANYGNTGAIDLLSILAGNMDAASPLATRRTVKPEQLPAVRRYMPADV